MNLAVVAEGIEDEVFYEPKDVGDEAPIGRRLADWRARRKRER